MALDIKPTRSELIKLKGRIKQTKNGYKLLKMKRDGLFHEFRKLLAEMTEAKRELTNTYRLAKQRIDLANAIEGGLKVRYAAIANSASPEVEVERRNIMGVVVPSVSGTNLKQAFGERAIGFTGSSPYIDEAADSLEADRGAHMQCGCESHRLSHRRRELGDLPHSYPLRSELVGRVCRVIVPFHTRDEPM